MNTDRLLSRTEAATWLGVSADTVRNLERRGEIQVTIVGRRPRYSLAALEAYVAKRPDGVRK